MAPTAATQAPDHEPDHAGRSVPSAERRPPSTRLRLVSPVAGAHIDVDTGLTCAALTAALDVDSPSSGTLAGRSVACPSASRTPS